MPFFIHNSKDDQGKTYRGVVEAINEKDAVSLLKKRGLFIISLTLAEKTFSIRRFFQKFKRVSFNDVVNFTRQLSTMVNAGLSLTDSLSVLCAQTGNPVFTQIVEEILKDVEGGTNFANALEKYPKLFPKIYISLIRAGEAAGMLDKILERLADNLEKDREFKGKTKNALIYPTVILLGMGGVVFVMMTFVIPKLTSLYQEFDVVLPLTTQILITVSNFMARFWWLIIMAFTGLVFLIKSWGKTKQGKKILDTFILNLPLFGNLTKEVVLVDFTRTLGVLVGAGIPILDALSIVSDSLGNVVFQDGIKAASLKVEKGFPLGQPISNNPIFPPILGQMVTVGEESGKLDETLLKLSKYFETESEQKIKGLTTLIEPLIIVILGVGVGFLVLSVVAPIYNLTAQF